MRGLEVWLDEREVGWLRPDRTLAYVERWVAEPLAYPLAPALPLPARGGPGSALEGDAVPTFFEQLLPEGEARGAIFAALDLAPDDVWQALGRLGRELAGAVRLVGDEPPAGRVGAVPRSATPMQRRIARDELSERLRHRDLLPLAVWDGQVRHALPGRRDKLGVYVDRGEWHLVDGPQIASTHLLKPAPDSAARSELPFDEFFCMRLAERVGLDVARVELHRVPEPVLLVERFDRRRLDDGRVQRLHAITARQALGRAAGEPVTDGERFALLRHSPLPLVDSRALLRWTLFRQLIGAEAGSDNLCFLVDHGGLRLAPAFGLSSDADAAARAGIEDWAAFARDGDIAPRSLALELKRMSELVPAHARALADELAGELPSALVDRLLEVVNDKARRMAGFELKG